MNNFKILKTYENYIDRPGENVSKEQIDNRIKEIISNILKTKKYFIMLQDTTENVYDMLKKQFPPSDSFFDILSQKNNFLSEAFLDILDILNDSFSVDEISNIVEYLEKLEEYIDGNDIEDVLSGEINIKDDYYEEEEEYDDEGEEVDIIDDDEIEDQLKRRQKLTESIKKTKRIKELEKFIKSHQKNIKEKEKPTEKTKPRGDNKEFKKGDIVWINGISGIMAKKFNGKKCEVIGKTEDKEDCYDLYDFTLPVDPKSKANIKGMPSEYIFKEKPEIIINKKKEKRS